MAVFTGNGSAVSPSITFSSDTDTGLFRPTANELSLTAGGLQQAKVSTLGLYVGPRTQRAQFHVLGGGNTGGIVADGATGGIVRIMDTSGSGGTGGTLIFGNEAADNENTNGPVALRSLLFDGSSRTRSHLAVFTRNVSTDTFLTERARFTENGYFLVGGTTPVFDSSTFLRRRIQVIGGNGFGMGIHRNDVAVGGSFFTFTKARGLATEAVINGDVLGSIGWDGANDSTYTEGAVIRATVDGTVPGGGVADMPARLEFATRAAGAASTTTRLQIRSSGAVRISSDFTVATLPTPASIGDIARVTDASAPAVGSTVVAGGAAAALCWYNGANWTVIGV